MNLIEQAKQLLELPKGTTSIIDLAPILRAFVEMAEKLQEHADFKPEIDPAEGECDPWIRIAAHGKKMARALLDKLRSES